MLFVSEEELVAERKRVEQLQKSEQHLQELCEQAGEALRLELAFNHSIASEAHRLHIIVTKCFSVLQAEQPPSRELHSFHTLQNGLDVFRCSCALLQQVSAERTSI